MNENELYHFGILGMKWGIRRYQNEDGTLTEAGKKRYRTNDKFAEKYDQGKRRKTYAEFNSEKELKKRYAEGNEKGQFRRRDATMQKISDELYKTDEYKKYVELNQALYDLTKISGGQVIVSEAYVKNYEKVYNAWINKGKQLIDDNLDQLASDVLTDLNYKDTRSGREYLKKIGFANWEAKTSEHPENDESSATSQNASSKQSLKGSKSDWDNEFDDFDKKAQKEAIDKVNEKYKDIDLTKDEKAAEQYDKDFMNYYNEMLEEYERKRK